MRVKGGDIEAGGAIGSVCVGARGYLDCFPLNEKNATVHRATLWTQKSIATESGLHSRGSLGSSLSEDITLPALPPQPLGPAPNESPNSDACSPGVCKDRRQQLSIQPATAINIPQMHCVAEVQINTVAPQNDPALEPQAQTRGPRAAVLEPHLGKPPATSILLGTCLKRDKN